MRPRTVEEHVQMLRRAVAGLSPIAKMAINEAAAYTRFAKGTWRGCVFNAAGRRPWDVTSSTAAARVFGMTEADVSAFIRAWDTLPLSAQESQRLLINMIREVGLDTEPGPPTAGVPARKRPRKPGPTTASNEFNLEGYDEVIAWAIALLEPDDDPAGPAAQPRASKVSIG